MWTVWVGAWVGSGEVNVNPCSTLTHDQAIEVASDWYNRGYDDVRINWCQE